MEMTSSSGWGEKITTRFGADVLQQPSHLFMGLGFRPADLVDQRTKAPVAVHVGVDEKGHVFDCVGGVELGEAVFGHHVVGRSVLAHSGQAAEADDHSHPYPMGVCPVGVR